MRDSKNSRDLLKLSEYFRTHVKELRSYLNNDSLKVLHHGDDTAKGEYLGQDIGELGNDWQAVLRATILLEDAMKNGHDTTAKARALESATETLYNTYCSLLHAPAYADTFMESMILDTNVMKELNSLAKRLYARPNHTVRKILAGSASMLTLECRKIEFSEHEPLERHVPTFIKQGLAKAHKGDGSRSR